MSLHPALSGLAQLMPPSGSVWKLEDRVTFLIAWDAALALIYGGEPHMIWLGNDGQIHIADRTKDQSRG